MGLQRAFQFRPGSVPAWESIRSKIAEAGESPVVRMIDGLPAFPDETPPDGWSEVRVGMAGGMITLRRTCDRIVVVTWGSVDSALEAARDRICTALQLLDGIAVDS